MLQEIATPCELILMPLSGRCCTGSWCPVRMVGGSTSRSNLEPATSHSFCPTRYVHDACNIFCGILTLNQRRPRVVAEEPLFKFILNQPIPDFLHPPATYRPCLNASRVARPIARSPLP